MLRSGGCAPCQPCDPGDDEEFAPSRPPTIAHGEHQPNDQERTIQEQRQGVDPDGGSDARDERTQHERPEQSEKPDDGDDRAEPQGLLEVEPVPARGVVPRGDLLDDRERPRQVGEGGAAFFFRRALFI